MSKLEFFVRFLIGVWLYATQESFRRLVRAKVASMMHEYEIVSMGESVTAVLRRGDESTQVIK
jgi:hypothetical protein